MEWLSEKESLLKRLEFLMECKEDLEESLELFQIQEKSGIKPNMHEFHKLQGKFDFLKFQMDKTAEEIKKLENYENT